MDHRERWPRAWGWAIAAVASLILWTILAAVLVVIVNAIRESF